MATEIQRLLIANRGEIARRIQRTCRRIGIETVAVFSDADAAALFVAEADLAVRIGGPAPADSYLRGDAILDAARAAGADAIHPGYGFLAENAGFAQAVLDAGMTWVGPSPAAIEQMGSKQRAKAVAVQAGVPVIPGYHGDDQSDATLEAESARIGVPLLVKASAGGGGKGMRVVRSLDELAAAVAAARREAAAAFGDDTLLLEKYVENPRHIEIQIVGDADGVTALFERECSVQRRHQKIVEEAPSAFVTPALRTAMSEAAESLGSALAYTNAGTVEFIVDADGSFYFLEVNTRLQVEHPVTEEVTGIDLVEQQLRIAEGHLLDRAAIPASPRGHAIEVRLYAEDVGAGFLPATGRLLDFHVPDGVRVETGVAAGDEVSVHYDPMIAKLIAHGASRAEAIRKLRRALGATSIAGLTTNAEFLRALLADPSYVSANVHTQWLEPYLQTEAGAALARTAGPERERARIAVVAAGVLERAARRGVLQTLPIGFRPVGSGPDREAFADGEVAYRILGGDASRMILEVDDARWIASGSGTQLTLEGPDALRSTYRVVRAGSVAAATAIDGCHDFELRPRFRQPGAEDTEGGCVAPMPGAMVAVHVAVGDAVTAGQPVAVLEAMKMEHTVTAPDDGTVAEVRVAARDQVEAGTVLLVIE